MGLWTDTSPTRHGARLRLFCLPYAGGSSAIFRGWERLLPSWIQVVPIHLPGRAHRFSEPLCTSLWELLPPLAAELTSLPSLPYAVFGHSMGALIGYELVRSIELRVNQPAQHLFVSGCGAPHCKRSRHRTTHQLTDEALIEVLHDYGETPDQLLRDQEAIRMFLPVIRADFQIVESYTHLPRPSLRTPITAFTGLNDDEVPLADCREWSLLSSQFHIYALPGDHFFIHQERDRLTSLIRSILL